MKTSFKNSILVLSLMAFGLTACSGNNPSPCPDDKETKVANHFFVIFTPPSTFASTLTNGLVEMSLNGGYAATDPHTNHSWWTDYYNYFQTVRNSHTFELKAFWVPEYLTPNWGMFRISQSGDTYTLSRIEGNGYVTVITTNSFAAIVDRLQFIYINGTPQHREAISKLDILSYRVD
jgi:hypothetical protein